MKKDEDNKIYSVCMRLFVFKLEDTKKEMDCAQTIDTE